VLGKVHHSVVTMWLETGSTPAPGVPTRRPRRVATTLRESLNGESIRVAQKVTGEGASHGARGGRAPLSLNCHGSVAYPFRG
jgi:hypothetical protein